MKGLENCENGGIKLEVGLDTNDNGILDEDEIDNTLTNFICNCLGNSNQSFNILQSIAGIGDYKWDIPGWDFDEFGSGTNSSEYITNNKIFCYPIKIDVQKNFSSFGFFPDSNWQDLPNVNLRIGIFSFDNGLPGELLYEFNINTYRLGSMNLIMNFLLTQAAILLV